jgi:hypothetical protein
MHSHSPLGGPTPSAGGAEAVTAVIGRGGIDRGVALTGLHVAGQHVSEDGLGGGGGGISDPALDVKGVVCALSLFTLCLSFSLPPVSLSSSLSSQSLPLQARRNRPG